MSGAGVEMGDGWELTSTVWEEYEGYTPSKLYPGYSSDFLSGCHNVLVGGSWCTHPRIAMRKSFRNWYQRDYGFAFATFRMVKKQ
jgi:formylglycine-generating enzyme required for sulfatase activity